MDVSLARRSASWKESNDFDTPICRDWVRLEYIVYDHHHRLIHICVEIRHDFPGA